MLLKLEPELCWSRVGALVLLVGASVVDVTVGALVVSVGAAVVGSSVV